MSKPLRIALVIAAIVAVLALRHWRGASASADDGGGLMISPAAAAFEFGKVAFKRCELKQPRSAATTRAFCAGFEVPENWDARDAGRTITLRVALIASEAPIADRDLVVLLAGGPGQSAIDSWPQVAGAFAPLRAHHHVLLLDQRGTGGSNALTCAHDDAAEQGFDLDKIRAYARACLAASEQHADVRQYTTTMALRDLEALRVALGAPPLDLVGVSYGTRVAQHYLHRYPNAVRSVVLDSAVPNENILGSDFAINLDSALKAQFALCKDAPACAKAFGDPWTSLHALRDQLRAQPIHANYRDPVDGSAATLKLDAFSLATLARMYAYTPETAALLPLSIAHALQGDAAPFAAQLQMVAQDLAGLSDNAMQLSVLCSEDADLLQPRAEDADTLLGTQLVDALNAQCAIWPHGTRPADFHAPIASDKPVLILAGAFDPVTPPRYAEQIAKGLPNGRVLVAKGQGHSVMGRGCFAKLVKRFVETRDAKNLDAGCIADFGPTPQFTNFNGAAP